MDEHENDKIVKLCSTLELVEYTLVKETLEQEGIECMDTPHVDSAYDDLFVPAQGYADIYVYETDLEEAKNILDALELPSSPEAQSEEETLEY